MAHIRTSLETWENIVPKTKHSAEQGLQSTHLNTDDVASIVVESWLDFGQQDSQPFVHSFQEI